MKKKKWRDVKNALVMVVVMAAMMSTATYAWFTLTSNATVTGMQMTAGGSSGLKVCETIDGSYTDAISLAPETVDGVPEENQVINQLTIDDGTEGVFATTFYKPVYGTFNNGVEDVTGVTGVEAIPTLSEVPNYAAKYTYFLKTEAEESAQVGLVIGAMPTYDVEGGLDANNMPKIDGSFVRTIEPDTNSAIYAVRIGLVVDGKMYVYEPNANGTFVGTVADVNGEAESYDGYTPTVQSNIDGTITVGESATVGTSKGLFTVTNTGTQVDMYVWLEGTDAQCADEIKADDIEAQVQFAIVD